MRSCEKAKKKNYKQIYFQIAENKNLPNCRRYNAHSIKVRLVLGGQPLTVGEASGTQEAITVLRAVCVEYLCTAQYINLEIAHFTIVR